ncbi:MAG TPA: GlsB/YeaQ/YmgE family stress response membrane protein [Acidobacteriota bacterium]|nr:GlsB/YeaQ/YmgE family stress response membrane protein [Acidobacteriota bacterium]
MSLTGLILLLVIAGICGGIGQSLAGYSHGGCLVSVALGFIGAVLGSWLAGLLGLPAMLNVTVGGHPFPVVWSIIGATLFVAVLGLFRKRSGGYR